MLIEIKPNSANKLTTKGIELPNNISKAGLEKNPEFFIEYFIKEKILIINKE